MTRVLMCSLSLSKLSFFGSTLLVRRTLLIIYSFGKTQFTASILINSTEQQATMVRRIPQFFGRCFSYPQGAVSVVPFILSLLAVTASIYTLPWTPWFDDVNFACIQRKTRMTSSGNDSTRNLAGTLSHVCYNLHVTNPKFWDERDDDMWGWAIQLGALFAIASAVLGFISLFHLLHATCFSLDAPTLDKIYKSYLACALLSLLTMIALAVDPCDTVDLKCSRYRTHLEDGATSEIAAVFFFLWAAWRVKEYADMVRNNTLPRDHEGGSFEMTHKDEEMEHLKEEDPAPAAADTV